MDPLIWAKHPGLAGADGIGVQSDTGTTVWYTVDRAREITTALQSGLEALIGEPSRGDAEGARIMAAEDKVLELDAMVEGEMAAKINYSRQCDRLLRQVDVLLSELTKLHAARNTIGALHFEYDEHGDGKKRCNEDGKLWPCPTHLAYRPEGERDA